jgi:putative oxidoreductase
MDIALLVAGVLVGLAFTLAGFQHGTKSVESLAPSAPWTAAVPLPLLRFIGLAELVGGVVTLVAPFLGYAWLGGLAAAGLALVMLLAAAFHATRREWSGIAVNLVLGGLAAFVAYGRLVAGA